MQLPSNSDRFIAIWSGLLDGGRLAVAFTHREGRTALLMGGEWIGFVPDPMPFCI